MVGLKYYNMSSAEKTSVGMLDVSSLRNNDMGSPYEIGKKINDSDHVLIPSGGKKIKKERKTRTKKINRLSEDQIRINHVSSEKKRREMVRAIYDELIDLVPDLQKNENRSELIIYLKTINYLNWLYKKNEKLRKSLSNANFEISQELVWELKKGD